jgi:phosphohistidine phosphatase
MLRVILLRHAKAVPHSSSNDRARNLNKRGEGDADRIGPYLEAEGLRPDLAIVSDAARARQTLERVLQGLTMVVPVRIEPKVYDASPSTLLASMRAAPGNARSLLLVGHNPGMAELALELAGSGEPTSLARMKAKFPTSGLAVIDFEQAAWPAIGSGGGYLERFVTPAQIGGEDD